MQCNFILLSNCDTLNLSAKIFNVGADQPGNIKHRLKYEPRSEKIGLRGFGPGPKQTGLYSHRRWIEV